MREKLAALCHEQWVHWMRYMLPHLTCRVPVGDGERIDMPNAVGPEWHPDVLMVLNRWRRQMDTPYAELSEKEKESDREQADKFLERIAERKPLETPATRLAKVEALLQHKDEDGNPDPLITTKEALRMLDMPPVPEE